MTNPIVVFVVPNRFGNNLKDKMPAGVTKQGQVEPAQKDKEYSLLFLNDTDTPPVKAPCKVCVEEPLLIVAHNNSEENSGTGKPLWNAKPTVCETFSHITGDPVFVTITKILESKNGDLKALEQFKRDCLNKDTLAALNGLAAICQIRLLNHGLSCEISPLNNEFLSRCPSISNRKFNKSSDDEKMTCLINQANYLLHQNNGG